MIVFIMMLCGLSVAVSMGHKLPLQEEGACFSMFNYEYHVVQKIVSLEGGQENNGEKIQAQKDQITAANERLEKMEQTLAEQGEQLTATNEQLKTMGQKIEERTKQHQQNLSNIEQVQKEQLAAMEDRLEEMKQLSETQAEQIANLSSVKSGKQVAFSVYRLNSALVGKTPTFANTAVNTGSFDMSTGKFTCPTAGQYYFSFSFMHSSSSSGAPYCYFHVNGSGLVYIQAHTSPYESASGSVIQHLSVNDVVSLDCGDWQNAGTGWTNAVFSGFLISQD